MVKVMKWRKLMRNLSSLFELKYGHKRFAMIGLLIFSIFSLASALSTTFHQLAIFRAFQGLGAALVAPSLLAILARAFADGTAIKTEAFAIYSAGSPLGTAIGLFGGGFLVYGTSPSWRSVSSPCTSLFGFATHYSLRLQCWYRGEWGGFQVLLPLSSSIDLRQHLDLYGSDSWWTSKRQDLQKDWSHWRDDLGLWTDHACRLTLDQTPL